MLVAALILFLALPQSTGNPPASTPEKAADKAKQECQVFGEVVQQEGGEPLKKAQVSLKPEDVGKGEKPYSQRTAEDGKFCFKDIVPGKYRLVAEHNGYVSTSYGADDVWSYGTVLALQKGQKLDRILLRLMPAGVIRGRIVDEDGDPAPGMVVEALVPQEEIASRLLGLTGEVQRLLKNQPIPIQMTVTNDLGEFRLAGLAPGKYFVNAVDTGGKMSPMGIMNGFSISNGAGDNGEHAPTYYPGTTRGDQAEAVDVEAGQEVVADIQLQHEQMVSVSGVVVQQDGTPPTSAFVNLTPSEAPITSAMLNRLYAGVESDGHFTIKHVLAGTYIASATSQGLKEGSLSARQRIEVGKEDVTNVRLVLTKGLTITGKIVAEGGALPKETAAYIEMDPIDDLAENAIGNITTDWELKINGLSPGTYKLAISGLPEQYFLKRVVYGQSQSTQGMLTVSEGQPEKLEVVISPNGAIVEGTVQDAKEAAVGGVLLLLQASSAKEGDFSFKTTATSDQNGKFSLTGLPPGSYTLNANWMKGKSAVHAAKVNISLAEGEKKTVTVKLEQ
jgi:protocatechuate 3,4-dioxygenase beta subunit